MTADGGLHLIFVNIATLHDQLISHHDRRSRGQPQPGILFGTISLMGFGYGLDLHFVLLSQPGNDFTEMPSRLSTRLIQKDSDFDHGPLLIL